MEEKFPLATTPNEEAVVLFFLGVIFEGMNVVPPKPGVESRLGRKVQGPADGPEVEGEGLVTVADKNADLCGHGGLSAEHCGRQVEGSNWILR